LSQRMVGIVIDRLLADEDLRVRFALDRIETMAELSFRGFELTPEEIDVFVRTNARLCSRTRTCDVQARTYLGVSAERFCARW
jgi:hypothetical protein